MKSAEPTTKPQVDPSVPAHFMMRWRWLAFGWLLLLVIAFVLWLFFGRLDYRVFGHGIYLMHGVLQEVYAPVSGILDHWDVEEGSLITKGQILGSIRTWEHSDHLVPIRATTEGVVAEFLQFPESEVKAAKGLMLYTPRGETRSDLKIIAFVSAASGKRLKRGMKAYILPTTVPESQGLMLGKVEKIANLPTGKNAIRSLVRIPELVEAIRQKIAGEAFYVVISPVRDESHITGYAWSGPGPHYLVESGTLANLFITYESKKPYEVIFASLLRGRKT